MSTKYCIQSLGFIGLLGFGIGLYGYWQTIAVRRVLEDGGDTSKQPALHVLAIVSQIGLWGGLALMLMSLIFYFLYRRWSKNGHAN